MKPTKQDILDLLPIVAYRGWKLNFAGAIRDKKGYCPVCALVDEIDHSIGEFRHTLAWTSMAMLTGENIEKLSGVSEIVDSADWKKDETREEMLQILGVKE